jgi:hypothetical protein
MKIKGWLMVSMLLISGVAFGQDEPPRFQEAMARMKAERVSFLTDKLQLTSNEAEKFWPIYNEYLTKREDLMWGKREKMPKDFDPSQLSEEEVNKVLNDVLDQEIKLAQLKKDYFIKIKSVIPAQKVLTLHHAEQEFMNHMLNKIRDNHKPGNPRDNGKRWD